MRCHRKIAGEATRWSGNNPSPVDDMAKSLGDQSGGGGDHGAIFSTALKNAVDAPAARSPTDKAFWGGWLARWQAL
jgi:dihydroxyacetone kinase